jgi:hypothetical protein
MMDAGKRLQHLQQALLLGKSNRSVEADFEVA